MLRLRIIFIVSCISSFFIFAGCTEANKSAAKDFRQLAKTGKQIFAQHKCSKCHNDSTSEKAFVPDLKRPFLAGNQILVDLHLNNTDISFMPEVELTQEEIYALSIYIATLHAAGQKTVSMDEADGRCPVCFAPVSFEAAKAASLVYTFSDKEYYFECQDCLELFKKIPEPYSDN